MLNQGTSTTLSLQSESDDACVTEMHAKRLMQAQDPKNGRQVELRRDIVGHKSPMPSQLPDSEQDTWALMSNPIPSTPSKIHTWSPSDLAFLVGPNVSFYTSSHPIGPQICNGSRGPEAVGKEIHVGEDCWIGRGAIFLTGMNIGTGSTVGTGSAVIKDVPPFHVVAGNPALRESLARTMSKESLDEAL